MPACLMLFIGFHSTRIPSTQFTDLGRPGWPAAHIIHLDSTKDIFVHSGLIWVQIGKFAECAGDLSFVRIACAAAFVSLNNSSIVSFCCFTKISRLEPRLKFKVRGGEIGRARQTFQFGSG